ncbi:MAG: sigma-70 family RNA polymerase sigma factor [Sedimentisphaerales bacterium]|nr:sigma-70 family RNA polymerase sigma factor [Sedimentisphaerales bacterium]
MISKTKETKLLQQCLNGKLQAFEAIVTNYQDLVCAITYSGTADLQQSEELAHQTFINAWKNLSQLKDLSKFSPWLCSIARNNIRNFLNKNQRDIIAKAKPMENINEKAADESSPLESAIKKEYKELVNDAIQQVPEQYRELLILYYRQQKSVKQVAMSLDLSEDTVKQRLQRGRNMIKEQLSSIVEETLSISGPKKAFATAVMASLAGLAITGTSVAAAAGIAATSTTTGTTTGAAAIMSGVTAKIITTAAILIIGIGAVVTYKHVTKPNPEQNISQSAAITISPEQEQEQETEIEIEEAIEAPVENPSQLLAMNETQSKLENEELVVKSPEPVVIKENIENKFVPKGILSGLITNAKTGEPIIDAEVSIGPGRLYKTKTDANGFYSFGKIDQAGDYSIGVYSNKFIGLTSSDTQPKMHLEKDGQAVQHFQLEKACMIDLYVVDEELMPISDARIWVTSLANEHGVEVGNTNTSHKTDENGYIRLGGFPPSDKPYLFTSIHSVLGDWEEKNGQRIREDILDFAPGYFKVKLTDPNVIEYGEIVLLKGEQVSGFAKYYDGTPAKECKIVPYPDWWHCNLVPPQFDIDPNGFFTMNQIISGTYRIQALIPEGGGGSIGITLFSAQLPSEQDKLFEVTIPQKPTPVPNYYVNTTRNQKLYGTVTDALTGKPIPEFRLRYQRMTSTHYSSEGKWIQYKNKDGAFSLDVIGDGKATCKVQAIAEGYAPKWSDETETDTSLHLELTPGGSIAGVVVDSEGNPVVNAKVLPYSLAGDPKTNIEPVFESEEGLVTTDESGQFTLENVAAGTETIKITHPDYTFTMIPDILVEEEVISDLGQITLNNGGIVEGFVYDSQGNPQSGVTLHAKNHFLYSSSEKIYAQEITDSNGYYRMENLPEDLCYIVRKRAYEQTGVAARAIIPSNNMIIHQDLGNGPLIRGRLIVDGSPLKDTQIMLTLGKSDASGLYRYNAFTDENGSFIVSAELPGTYTLSYERRTQKSMTLTTKLTDIVVGYDDIDLGIVPAKKQTLTITVEASEQQEKSITNLNLHQKEPYLGAIIYWKDEPKSNVPYEISIPEPGLYYACIRYDGKEYQYPIEIPEDQINMDVTLPIQEGNVTVTGALPGKIKSVRFFNSEYGISGTITNNKSKDGLLPGTYYFNPKLPNFNDSIVVTIPDSTEFTLKLDTDELIEKLKEHLYVQVFDQDGQSVENANVWIAGENSYKLPDSKDNYSSEFFLPDGEFIIQAEKDGINATKIYKMDINLNNISSGETFETFIQLK